MPLVAKLLLTHAGNSVAVNVSKSIGRDQGHCPRTTGRSGKIGSMIVASY